MKKQQEKMQCSPPPRWRFLQPAAALFFAAAMSYHLPGAAAENRDARDTHHGVIHVHGSLTESACRLATSSVWQTISMGETATGQLKHVGDRGRPVRVELKLEDCGSSASRSENSYTGNVLWSNGQPAISISFQAPADNDNPELIRVSGASGLALRLTDRQGKDVRLGGFGTPLLLTPGQNQLTYTLTPERTRATLGVGSWWALINIGLSYE